MVTTISKTSKGNRLRRPLRSREGDYSGRGEHRTPRTSEAARTGSVSYGGDGAIQEERIRAYPAISQNFSPCDAHSSKENRTSHGHRGWYVPDPLGSPLLGSYPPAV